MKKILIAGLLGGFLGYVLVINGLTVLTWGYWLVLLTTVFLVLNA